MNSKFSFGKVLMLTLLAFALVFSACQNPVGSDIAKGGNERAVATVYNRPPSADPPGGLLVEEVPMFVSFGWDDNGKSEGMNWILDYVKGKTNPAGIGNIDTYDGEQITMTFFNSSYYVANWGSESPVFVKQSWKRAYDEGHEIGNHTNNHPHGQQFSVEQWNKEIDDCNTWLTTAFDPNEVTHTPTTSGIGVPESEIYGFRTPYLEYNDNLLQALYNRNWYDASIEEGFEYDQDGTNHFWPFTLDNGAPGHDIQVEWGSKQPLTNHPGMWEMPVYVFTVPPELRQTMKSRVSWFDVAGGKITGFDYNLWISFSMSKAELLATLKHTFDLRMQGNRAPMLIGAHTDYYVDSYKTPSATMLERRQAIEEFIDYTLTFSDTRIVSYKKALDWVKNPTALKGIATRYTVEASTDGGGTISPAGPVVVAEGSNKTFYFEPSFGSEVASIEVNGGAAQPYTATSYTMTNISGNGSIKVNFRGIGGVDPAKTKSTALSLVSIAENSSPFLVWNYAEDIGDGRGITFGICGFTSGTYDGTYVIKALKRIDPSHVLVSYLPAFEAIDALPHDSDWKNGSTAGLENFIADWNAHGEDKVVMQAQLEVLHDKYWNPAQAKAQELGMTLPLSMAFTYDTTINHGADGSGTDKGLKQLTDEATAAAGGTPATGVDEKVYLRAFFDARKAYLESDPSWAGALDRIEMYRRILDAGNEMLPLPLPANCYWDDFLINGTEIDLSLNSTFHSVNVFVDQGGYVVPYGNVRVPHGADIFLGISVDEGNQIEKILVDGANVGVVNNYTIRNVIGDHSVEAWFEPFVAEPINVTVTSGPNGTTNKEGLNTITKRDDFIITCQPDAGYKVGTATVNGAPVTVVDNVLHMNVVVVDSDVQISYVVDDRPQYAVTVTAGANGSSPQSGVNNVVEGNNLTVNFVADAGFKIDDVTLDGVSQGAVSTVSLTNVTAAHTVAATFVEDVTPKFTITAAAGANGTISPVGDVVVSEGGSQSFTITPATGYVISDVVVNGVSVGAVASYEFINVTANATISASFTILPDCPYPAYVDGEIYTGGDIVHHNGHDYKAKWWTQYETPPGNSGVWEDLGECGPAPTYYDVTATAGANGSISPAGTQSVEEGSVVSYAIAAAAGYDIEDVIVNGVSQGAVSSLSVTVTANTTVSASFKLLPPVNYDITATAGANGSITPAGTQSVLAGTVVEYVITADAGYEIDDVVVDGVSQGPVAALSVTVTGTTTVAATFKLYVPPVFYNVTGTAGANGSVTPAGTQSVEEGTVVSFTIAADAGYEIEDVTLNGVSQGAVTSLDVTVTAETTVAATFKVKIITTPEWSADSVVYALGDEVSYGGAVYVCKYAHTSNSAWVPGTPGLWIWELK